MLLRQVMLFAVILAAAPLAGMAEVQYIFAVYSSPDTVAFTATLTMPQATTALSCLIGSFPGCVAREANASASSPAPITFNTFSLTSAGEWILEWQDIHFFSTYSLKNPGIPGVPAPGAHIQYSSVTLTNGDKMGGQTVTNYDHATLDVSQRDSLAVFRPVGGLPSGASGIVIDQDLNYMYDAGDGVYALGIPGDQVVAGDWTGSGIVSAGLFRCGAAGTGECQWLLDLNGNGVWDGPSGGDALYSFGLPGDIAVAGDWTGNGVTRIGVFRCTGLQECIWVLDENGNGAFDASDPVIRYGLPGDLPVVSNWTGQGREDQVGVYRGSGVWVVDSNGDRRWEASDAIYFFGLSGDLPVTGVWKTGARKSIGVFRNGQWVLDMDSDNAYGVNDQAFNFGLPGDSPVVGIW